MANHEEENKVEEVRKVIKQNMPGMPSFKFGLKAKIAVGIIVLMFFVLPFLKRTLLTYKVIRPGHVGIKVNMAGGQRGVDDFPTKTGYLFYIPILTQVVEYPVFVQTATWTGDSRSGRQGIDDSISFNTKDQMTVHADINLSYIIQENKVPNFYMQFRSDNLDNFTHGYLHNVAKDAFNNIGSRFIFDEINGEHKEKVMDEVKERINSDVNKYGVIIQQFGLLGALRPPQQIMDSITAKMGAIQKAQQAENELREAKAQAAKAVAKAEGEAKANAVLAQSISPALIQWRQLEITQQAIAKWNGARPMVEGTGGSGLLLQLPLTPGK